jgi:DNA-binding response OmpR family regulator
MRILLIDDDERLGDTLNVGLQLHWANVEVSSVAMGEPGLEAFAASQADFVLLDVGSASLAGFAALRAIRQVSNVPVIIFTARGDEIQQVRGFQLGANDCLHKPFGLTVLMARIKVALRHARLPAPVESVPDFTAGELTIRFRDHAVMRAGRPIKLTPVEYKVLYQLVKNAGSLMPHQALLDGVWGCGRGRSTEYLRLFIGRLRAKLEAPDGPRHIRTERNCGYRFVGSAALDERANMRAS